MNSASRPGAMQTFFLIACAHGAAGLPPGKAAVHASSLWFRRPDNCCSRIMSLHNTKAKFHHHSSLFTAHLMCGLGKKATSLA